MERRVLLASHVLIANFHGANADGSFDLCNSFTVGDKDTEPTIWDCPQDRCELIGATEMLGFGNLEGSTTAQAECQDRNYVSNTVTGNHKMKIVSQDECAYAVEEVIEDTFAGTISATILPHGCVETAQNVWSWNLATNMEDFSVTENPVLQREVQCSTYSDCQTGFWSQSETLLQSMHLFWTRFDFHGPDASPHIFASPIFTDDDVDSLGPHEYFAADEVERPAYCFGNDPSRTCVSPCGLYQPDACPTDGGTPRCSLLESPLERDWQYTGQSICVENCAAFTSKSECGLAATYGAIGFFGGMETTCVWDARDDECKVSCELQYAFMGECPPDHCETRLMGELNSETMICQAKCEIYGTPATSSVVYEYNNQEFMNCPSTWLQTKLASEFFLSAENVEQERPLGRCQWFKGTCQDTCSFYTVENCPKRRCDASDGACKLPCAELTENFICEGEHGDRCTWMSNYVPTDNFLDTVERIITPRGHCEDTTPAPTPAPTCAEDNPLWYYGEKDRTCANFVAKDPKLRCRMKGRLVEPWETDAHGQPVDYAQNHDYSIRTKASEACPTTCGGCGCSDDVNWQLRVGQEGKSCKWVAKKPETRCGKMGIDGEGNEVRACDGCCYSCRGQEKQFRPFESHYHDDDDYFERP